MKYLTATMLFVGAALAAPAAAPEPQSTGSDSPPSYSNTEFQQYTGSYLNSYRGKHSAPPMGYQSYLGQYAYKYANTYGSTGSEYGEDMYYFKPSSSSSNYNWEKYTKNAIDWWMQYQSDYNPSNPSYPAEWYTQVVWKSSRNYGCAWSSRSNSNGYYYFYCEFDPKGNYEGGYESNVSSD